MKAQDVLAQFGGVINAIMTIGEIIQNFLLRRINYMDLANYEFFDALKNKRVKNFLLRFESFKSQKEFIVATALNQKFKLKLFEESPEIKEIAVKVIKEKIEEVKKTKNKKIDNDEVK